MRIVDLPWPSPALSPNARVHYLAKHRAATAYRLAAAYHGRSDGRKPLQNPVCAVLPLVRTRRRRDLDNALASLKSALDGLTDAGWWADDSDIDSFHLIPHVYSPKWAEPRVLVVATERSDAAAMSQAIELFRGGVIAGNAHAALAGLKETARPADGGPR